LAFPPFTALLTTNTEINHADISANVTAVNRAFQDPSICAVPEAHLLPPAERRSMPWFTQQAQIIAYIDDYKLLLIATLALFALLVFFKKNEWVARTCSRRGGLDCIECTNRAIKYLGPAE